MNATAVRSAEPSAPPQCPMHGVVDVAARRIAPTDTLVFPLHRRVVTHVAMRDDGVRELRLYHGASEISFDEPELFAFGEALATHARFVAGDALDWVDGQPWSRIAPLLQSLVDAGILQHADDAPTPRPRDDGARPSPLPPATATHARSWNACDAVFADVTGTPLEIGHLELVVPVFRVAHVALDAEGRQVGEANVFPPALRVDVATRWRTCIYAGSRHQADRPMNVSALKSMRAHWGSMMAALLAVRAAYLARFPAARGGWTVGHLERLSTAVLALATHPSIRAEKRVANGDLHPALSCLFRVTDGLRMTMHQMLFVPIGEPTLSPDAPMTSAEIHAYAERNYAFHSEHGVCAGPAAMIDEFLAVLVDGREPKDGVPAALDPAIVDALDHVEAAIDYALLGLKVYAAVFSLWPRMTRAYEALTDAAAAWVADGSTLASTVHARFAAHVERARTRTYLARESWRADRDAVYADMDAQCTVGLTGAAPAVALPDRLRPRYAPDHAIAIATLRMLVARRDECRVSPSRERFVAATFEFLAATQAVLREACTTQYEINRRLGRPQPTRPMTAHDLDLHNRLSGERSQRLPYLVDELEALFGLAIAIDSDSLAIVDASSFAPGSSPRAVPDSVGMGPAGLRA